MCLAGGFADVDKTKLVPVSLFESNSAVAATIGEGDSQLVTNARARAIITERIGGITNIGSAASRNAGYGVGQLPPIGSAGKLPHWIIPDSSAPTPQSDNSAIQIYRNSSGLLISPNSSVTATFNRSTQSERTTALAKTNARLIFHANLSDGLSYGRYVGIPTTARSLESSTLQRIGMGTENDRDEVKFRYTSAGRFYLRSTHDSWSWRIYAIWIWFQ